MLYDIDDMILVTEFIEDQAPSNVHDAFNRIKKGLNNVGSTAHNKAINKMPTKEEIKSGYIKYWNSQKVVVGDGQFNAIDYCYDYICRHFTYR